ncbi:replicative DNA helicase [Nesterenkonia lacusekhoensis]|uniref:DNA 5'-3' helicase n=1 Tax=Nesterenkonia lacusekhoensis TaxID=150832 RepID=A0ABS4T6T1_9MICC|nr:DnaB-like helicase C-terminal domain-containing protein [Nesterenkonia lacusekhoensis]MBP2319586.1 replicative DNA helicase [Nesterenkonia lacusekhoensis]
MNSAPPEGSPSSHSENTAEAERNLLGAILLSSGRVLDYLTVEPADYASPQHEQIHHAALTLKARGVPPDQVTVAEELIKHQARVDSGYLHALASRTATPSSAEYYAHIVIEGAARRRALQAANEIRVMVDSHADPQQIQEKAQKALDGITPAAALDPVRFTEETLAESLAELESERKYIPTPWPSLDDMLGGLIPGALYTIGARPGAGKTVAGVQLATALARHGSVPFISLEMSTAELHNRMLSAAAKVPFGRIRDRELTEDDWNKIAHAVPALEKLSLTIMDRPNATIGEIRRFVTAAARTRAPLAGVVLDYLQLIESPPGDKRPRHEYIASLTRELKILAKEHQVPVILLSQLNRGSAQREDKLPQLADLRESGAIEQDSDAVILLHRLADDPDKMHEIDFRVAKNRHGRPGKATLDFWGHYATIRDPRSS